MALRIGRLPIIAIVVLLVVLLLLVLCEGKEENEGSQEMQQRGIIDDDDAGVDDNKKKSIEYGVDVSFPMHHAKVSDNFAWLKHNTDPASHETPRELKGKPISPFAGRQDFYNNFLETCVHYYGERGGSCRTYEDQRIQMTLRQPQSMQNYTESGFKKIKAPKELFKLISDFWETNKEKETKEQWGIGNTYTNSWMAPTYMVSVEDKNLRGGGYNLKQKIWDAVQIILQEWTGEELTQCSLYGIRVYKTDAILASHVDRLPLVSSAIINVDADVDEPWPLEVIGHNGKASNVTMVPGDMVLYESHSVIHGRPFPLKGRYVANLFIHFEPTGHTLRHNDANANSDTTATTEDNVHEKYRKAVENGIGGHESAISSSSDEHNNIAIPPYVVDGTPEANRYRQNHKTGWKPAPKPTYWDHVFAVLVNFFHLEMIYNFLNTKCHPYLGRWFCRHAYIYMGGPVGKYLLPTLFVMFVWFFICTLSISYYIYKKRKGKKKKSV